MQFNVAKCKVMHLGNNNIQQVYTMNGQQLGITKEEVDIGVAMIGSLKPSAQCRRAARTAQTVLGQLARGIHNRDRNIFLRLYQQYVRPHLEFASPAWSPWQEGDKECLEKVQRRAVGMIAGLKSRDYSERLKELGLTTLEEVERVTFTDTGLEAELKAKRKASLTCTNCAAELHQEWLDCPYCLTPRFHDY